MRLNLPDRLYNIDLREFGISALVAALALFVAAMAMLNQNVSQLRQSFVWADQAHAIQKRIDDVNNLMNCVELTVRGYALTGDPAYIRRHHNTLANLMTVMRELRALTAVEPALRPDYADLEKAVAQHEALYSSLIGQNQAVIADAISSPAKRHFKERANAALTGLETMEKKRVALRLSQAERDARATYATAIGVAALAFLIGTLGCALTLFGLRRTRDPQMPKEEPLR